MSSSAEASTVQVSGLSPTTTEASLDQFFSFCGKIKSITRLEKTATIVFEKASAAKTSLMLNGGTLDSTTITVTGSSSLTTGDSSPSSPNPRPTSGEGDDLKQEDKPRSAIAAEYLAHGYVLGDQAIAKAIALDEQHGISSKFLSYFKKIDTKFKIQEKTAQAQAQASTRAQTIDQQTGASKKVGSLFQLGYQYYEKALSSPHASKVREFYTKTSKQVLDVHAEATRIAEQKAGHPVFKKKGPNNETPLESSTNEPSNPGGSAPGYDVGVATTSEGKQ